MRKYRLNEIDSIPESPGIYAWYASIQIGTSDWEKIIDSEGDDLGKENFKNVLAKHTQRYSPPSVKVNVNGSFRDSWAGKISPDRYVKYVEAINSNSPSEESEKFHFPGKEMERVLGKEFSRGRFAKLLTENSLPIFSAPLYIGKSDNLKQRVGEHCRDIEKWYEVAKKDPSHREKIKSIIFGGLANDQIPDIFATRAIACGFNPENLEIYVLDIAQEMSVSLEQAKELASVYEWFLNTWNRPIFGRA